LALALFPNLLHAGLVQVDTTFGPNTAVLDTNTGLIWLDLTVTANQSYNYVSSQLAPGGAYDGWRFATADSNVGGSAELTVFFEDAFPGSFYGETTDPYAALNLMDLLGGPLYADSLNEEYTSFGLIGIPYGFGHAVAGYLSADLIYHTVTTAPYVYGSATDGGSSSAFGSWLVEDSVPEPASFALFALGGSLLAMRRFRRAGK
jgi:hypothetical protein